MTDTSSHPTDTPPPPSPIFGNRRWLRWTLYTLFIGSLTFNIVLIGSHFSQRIYWHGGITKHISKEIGLDDSQRDDLRAMIGNVHKEWQQLAQESRQDRMDLLNLLAQSEVDDAAVNAALEKLFDQIENKLRTTLYSIRTFSADLTPAQRADLFSKLAEYQNRMDHNRGRRRNRWWHSED